MARHRQTGSRNWARGALASFWILLAGISGVYLFTVFNDPTLGGQLVKLRPASSGETTSAVAGDQASGAPGQDLAAIQESVRALSQQVAELSSRLEGSDTRDAPGASSAPSPSASSSAENSAEPVSPLSSPEEPKPAQAEAPLPPAPPQPEARPIEQAAVEAKPSPPPAPEATPPKPYEPPPVAVSPLDELPAELESQASGGSPAPAPEAAEQTQLPAPAEPEPAAASTPPPPAATETAALDPVVLPPAANDGSTRYGIEIGVVAKQDGLRPLWREFLTNHAALVAGLQPRRVLAPDKKWRLIAGPFTSAAEAAQACALFKKASRPCEATVYAGDSL
jgi:sporulation related protein